MLWSSLYPGDVEKSSELHARKTPTPAQRKTQKRASIQQPSHSQLRGSGRPDRRFWPALPRLFNHRENVACVDCLTDLKSDLDHFAVTRRLNLVLHLHRFDHNHTFACFYVLAGFDENAY